jgi:hypothetical protein
MELTCETLYGRLMKGIYMKKISSVVSLSFLVLLLLVGCVSSSSSLVKSGNDVSYKTENIQINGGKYIVQVWEKEVYSDKGREELIQKMRDHKMATERYDKLKETMSLYEINCKKKRKNVLSITDYDTDGKVLFSHSYDKEEWVYIVPDSKIDKFQKEVCK